MELVSNHSLKSGDLVVVSRNWGSEGGCGDLSKERPYRYGSVVKVVAFDHPFAIVECIRSSELMIFDLRCIELSKPSAEYVFAFQSVNLPSGGCFKMEEIC